MGASMSTLHNQFNALASQKVGKYPPPFSLRLTFEERARLDVLRGNMPLGQYIREQLLGDDAAPRKRRVRTPVKDEEALGRVLAELGNSRLSQNLNQLARAVNTGSLPVSPEVEADLRDACRAVAEMREALLKALGSRPSGGEP
ncbi:MAG: Bacterial mobilization protein (MobC) [Rhodobacteraceae bacterium HLUCCO18]|nr:MAG: Bacterial mobilization protein (MobC) [Rhodobacteraceae bacterium HLUCCO18]